MPPPPPPAAEAVAVSPDEFAWRAARVAPDALAAWLAGLGWRRRGVGPSPDEARPAAFDVYGLPAAPDADPEAPPVAWLGAPRALDLPEDQAAQGLAVLGAARRAGLDLAVALAQLGAPEPPPPPPPPGDAAVAAPDADAPDRVE